MAEPKSAALPLGDAPAGAASDRSSADPGPGGLTAAPAHPGPRFYTIGHSTRSVAELAALLGEAGADLLADVRTVPRSRTNPQFNADTLPGTLARYGLGYRHLRQLGGLRGRRKDAPPSPNSYWENDSFRNYADYAATPEFRAGLAELCALGRVHVCAIMCAEAVWWRCHRRIIADYLLAAGEPVFHIMGPGKIEPAHMTPAAVVQPDGTLAYSSGS
jgi:uncharacterized protein (DUF488 family)